MYAAQCACPRFCSLVMLQAADADCAPAGSLPSHARLPVHLNPLTTAPLTSCLLSCSSHCWLLAGCRRVQLHALGFMEGHEGNQSLRVKFYLTDDSQAGKTDQLDRYSQLVGLTSVAPCASCIAW